MAYIYFNQNAYPNVPYPSPSLPKATVKSGGCGPTCGAIIVSNLTSQTIDPAHMASFAIKCGARVNGGTDMNRLAKAISEEFGIKFTATNDETVLAQHLRAGGMAIANVGGDRAGYTGVFSNGGHYIVVAGMSDDNVIILDPGFYNGKFLKAGRRGKVTVKGNECICSMFVLSADTANRSPQYWLFERKVEEVPEWMKKIIDDALAAGLITERHNPEEPAKKWFVLAIALNMLKVLKGGK
jgi:hypothetical protein